MKAAATWTALMLAACAAPGGEGGLPAPVVPEDNPLTEEAIELGRHLFYDARLSVNQAISCSSCHIREHAFADDRDRSPGAAGETGALNTPSLANVAYANPLTWAKSGIATIEEQLLGPMFGEAPIEMGMGGREEEIAARLRAEPRYAPLFDAAFAPGALDQATVIDDVRFALASFTRSLVSSRSPFDRFIAGEPDALTASQRRGSELFYSTRLGCSNCHAGPLLTEAIRTEASAESAGNPYHNIGLYNVDAEGGYPAAAPGLIADTGRARDAGRFRVPSLRNVGLTAPYMHDGSVADLAAVIAIYEAGGRDVLEGPDAGDGRANPWRSPELRDFSLTDAERGDLIAFLGALTDEVLVADPAHADPW